jgi:hypothetical protein
LRQSEKEAYGLILELIEQEHMVREFFWTFSRSEEEIENNEGA